VAPASEGEASEAAPAAEDAPATEGAEPATEEAEAAAEEEAPAEPKAPVTTVKQESLNVSVVLLWSDHECECGADVVRS